MRRFPPSPIASLVDEAPLYNLGESYCRELTVGELLDGDTAARLEQVVLAYGTSAGAPGLRELLASHIGVGAEEVVVTAGAAPALSLLAVILAESGADVVVMRPCFPPFMATLLGIGANVVTVQLHFEEGYRLNVEALERKLSPRTRLVALATPQNPSGVAIARATIEAVLEAMATVCAGAFLLVDEVYREAVYGAASVPPSLASLSGRVVTCGSLSKSHGAPGLRIGWMTVRDPALREQLRLARFNTSLSCGTVDEFLAAEVLRRSADILAPRRAFLAAALKVVEEWVDANPDRIRWVRPDAGALCCIQLNPASLHEHGVRRFQSLLAQSGILLAPGEWFGDSVNVFRLGFGYEPIEKLRAGLAVISDVLSKARAARVSS